jgi:hypothetical protein
MQGACNVRGRNWDDEVTLGLDLAIRAELGLEKITFLPPFVPAGFNDLGIVRIGRLLLLDLVGLLFSLDRCGFGRSSLCLLLGELLRLLGLSSFSLY